MTNPRSGNELSQLLRQLRTTADMTALDVSELTGFSRAKISRFETGKFVPKPEEAEAFARAVKASPSDRRRAIDLASDVREMTAPRAVLLRPGSSGAQRMQARIKRIDAQSTHVGQFANALVPGLLQTADYQYEVFASAGAGSETEVRAAVAERQDRQRQAHSSGRQYVVIASLGALTWPGVAPDVAVRQLERITELIRADEDHFRIGVVGAIPAAPAPRTFPLGPFDVYDQGRVVVVGTYTATALLNKPVDTDAYQDLFERVTTMASFGRDALPWIERAAALFREDSHA